MDNAANNKTMMAALERKLKERDIPFDAADRQIMCYAHIINLSSAHIIQEITKVDKEASVVSRSRAVVQAIRSSGKRRDAFQDMIKDGNAKGWFRAGQPPQPIVVKQLELLRHIQTRWDSLYHMLNRLREMRPVLSIISVNSLLLIT
jgi:hypothetical protein